MSQLPFFTWHNNIMCAAVGQCCRCGVWHVFCACHFSLRLCHTEPSSLRVVAEHNNMCCEKCFWWNVSVEKKFGLLFWCAAPSIILASFALAPLSFALIPQQMAVVNFVHFYFVKWYVKIIWIKKVTPKIKFKKYKIVNKRSTYSFCTFLTFQTVINNKKTLNKLYQNI